MNCFFKKTVANRIIQGDKNGGRFSHAYLIVCEDAISLPEYLTDIAKIMMCNGGESDQRTCRLIDNKIHTDVKIYPKGDAVKILVADIDDLVSDTYIKPFEADKKIYIINFAESMNLSAQNKLLKTLEEPPAGVYIIIGTSNENALLATVKSRVKKIEIPAFPEEEIIEGLKEKCHDLEKLKKAAALADGKPGNALRYYNDGDFCGCEQLVFDVLQNMSSSKDVITYTDKIDKTNIKEFLITLKKVLNEIVKNNEQERSNDARVRRAAEIYKTAACLAIINKINEFERALFFNGNINILADGILLSVLEEKYRWKKL